MTQRLSQTTKDAEDNKLILYRLDRVEAAVKDVGTKVDRQDNIKRSDLLELRDTIVNRITEIRSDLQRQIDDKADATTVSDIKKLVYGFGSLVGAILTGLVIFYITNKK